MVGSQVTNRIRLIFALLYLVILNLILFHEPLPFSAESSRWIWLGLSGVIGLSLGDAFYFQSLVSVGARLGSLLLSLAPIFGSIIAWIFFGETLSVLQITGIALALAGIGWVVMSHRRTAQYPSWTYSARCVLRRAGRTGSGNWTRSIKTGNVRRVFTIPGKCDPYACRDDFHLDMDWVSRKCGRDI